MAWGCVERLMNKIKFSILLTLALALLLVSAVSCGSGAGPLDSMSQTLTPLSEAVRQTATARAGNPGAEEELATAFVRATEKAAIVYGTQTAVAALNDASRLATATAIAPVVAELPRYGIDPAAGYVAWLHDPVTINLEGYQQTGYANDYENITALDFVLAADITWNTFNSASGCGFMFRSSADTNQPSQYIVLISRVANGQMVFLGMNQGKISNFKLFYPKGVDKSFDWFNGATNRLAVVVRGKYVDLYTNGEWIGQVDVTVPPSFGLPPVPTFELPPGATDEQKQDYQNQMNQINSGVEYFNSLLNQAIQNFTADSVILDEGFLGFIAMSQSGTMTCTFDKAWLFKLNP